MVDTSAKFDAILICHSKAITRPVLPLAGTLIGTIMTLIMDFFQNMLFLCFFVIIFIIFYPEKVEKCFFLVYFA